MVCTEKDINSTINIALNKPYSLSQWKKNTSYWDNTTPSKLTNNNLSTDYTESPAWGNVETGGIIQGNIFLDLESIQEDIALIKVLSNSHPFYLPTKVMAFISEDNVKWTPLGTVTSKDSSGFWNIYPQIKGKGRYVLIVCEKNDCGGTKERFHVSEVQVFRSGMCYPTQIKTRKVVPTNSQNDWGFNAYGDYAYVTQYLEYIIRKVNFKTGKIVATNDIASSDAVACSHILPQNNHILIGGNHGSLFVLDLNTLNIVEDLTNGILPVSQTTDKCWEGITSDSDYVYFNEGYQGKIHIHNVNDYSQAETPVTVINAHTWNIETRPDLDIVAVIKGDDTWGPGGLYFLNKDDWSVTTIDTFSQSLFSVVTYEDKIFVGGNGVLKGYDLTGSKILDETVSNVVYNLDMMGSNLLYTTNYSTSLNTAELKMRSVNDLNFVKSLGNVRHGLRGKSCGEYFLMDHVPLGSLTRIKF